MNCPSSRVAPYWLCPVVVWMLAASAHAEPAGGNWAWLMGTNTVGQAGIYGTLGSPDPDSAPGARQESIAWMDSDDRLWLFGGYGRDSAGSKGMLNDLWRYDPGNEAWTWLAGSNLRNQAGVYGTKGTPHADNRPGGREDSVCWRDAEGYVWLFGGYGYDSAALLGLLNDLWRYDPDTAQWTWISGSSSRNQGGTYGTKGTPAPGNVPGARQQSIAWHDGDDGLWLFGGNGRDSVMTLDKMNDLWRFDISTGQWTWMSGSHLVNQSGVYGTQGVQHASNVPGARWRSTAWADSAGRFWLFGGMGRDKDGQIAPLNDLWRYDPVAGMWTWVGGSNTVNPNGVYGTKGVPAADTVPGGRENSAGWLGAEDVFWLFGGWGRDSLGSTATLNDLWCFDSVSGLWTWMGGSNLTGQLGLYGTRGVVSSGNGPGARQQSSSWIDSNGRLWLFGGNGYDINGTSDGLNDLWRYSFPPRILALLQGDATTWEIQWLGSPGEGYRLQETTNLVATAFSDVGAPQTCLPGTNSTLRATAEPTAYWRFRTGP